MAILVTGGAGYIGSITTECLINVGEEVVVIDDLSTGHREAIPPNAKFYQGSTLDETFLTKVFSENSIEAVFHFAAYIQVGESCISPSKYFRNNFTGSQTLLDVIVQNGVEKFVFSSTAAVYGNPIKIPIDECQPCSPVNPYGLSKRMVEQVLEWYNKAYGLRFVALRYFNAAGATQERGEDHHPESHLVPNVIFAALDSQKSVKVFGNDYNTPDGTCIRDYIHVVDLAQAHIAALKYLRSGGNSDFFNLGTERGVSVLEVIRAVQEVTGRKIRIEWAERRKGDAEQLVASSQKARQFLKWKPEKSDITCIVEDAWKWRLHHPRGYSNPESS